ncbi:MAG: hypothetical protein IAF02_24850 [Anaerolineae bacterium]|nr:hypothetical protein [Anaerolineae bacterium]
MGKFIAGMVVTAVVILLIFVAIDGSQPGNASEIEAMARYEMIRGQNQVNLTYARADVFNQQMIIFGSILCFGVVVLMLGFGVFLFLLGGWQQPNIENHRDQNISIGYWGE